MKDKSKQRCRRSAHRALEHDHLTWIACRQGARKGVIHAPCCRSGQDGDKPNHLTSARFGAIEYQDHTAEREHAHGQSHSPVEGLVIPKPCQDGSENRLQRQHERRTGSARMLESPGQRDRANARTKYRHQEKPPGIATLNTGLAVDRLTEDGTYEGGARVEQRGRREAAHARSKALDQWRTDPE